jgi:peptidoglycan/LPS O-acetylase OafA/YrhL
MSRTSVALYNLRGFAIIMVVAFHSCIAYLASQPVVPPPFDAPPYRWLANPIVDDQRWLGLDLFCAFQYMYLMHLMFFLSGLFVYPSLVRKGAARFAIDRLCRLGLPFAFGVLLLIPLAYYPVYRVTAVDPAWSAYLSHWRALPFWPSGPLWFLWVLLICNLVFVAASSAVPRLRLGLAALSADAGAHPVRFAAGLFVMAALAYLPLSMVYKPWDWVTFGPLAFQPSFVAPYAVFYLAGVSLSAHGYERGLLQPDGSLARRWLLWSVIAMAAFLVWIIPTALIVKNIEPSVAGLQLLADLGSVLASATISLALVAIFLNFATAPRPMLGRISANAYPIYLVHYLFIIWIQYLLLDANLPAVTKAAVVFAGTLLLSWASAVLLGGIPVAARLMLEKRGRAGSH